MGHQAATHCHPGCLLTVAIQGPITYFLAAHRASRKWSSIRSSLGDPAHLRNCWSLIFPEPRRRWKANIEGVVSKATTDPETRAR